MDNNTINNTEETVEIDLGELFRAVWSKIWIIVAATVLCAAIAGNITYFLIEPTYTSTSTVYLLPREENTLSQNEMQIGTQMTSDAAKLAKSKSVIVPVLKDLRLDMDYETLSGLITVNNPTDTRLIEITAENTDPQTAADIANSMADSLCDQVSTIMQTDRPTIAEKAVASEKPSAPSMTKNVVIAALLGLFLSLVIIVINFIRDDTIKTTEDVEKYLKLNTLAAIPMEYSDDESSIRKKLHGRKSGR